MKASPFVLVALITAATPFSLTAATLYWDTTDMTSGAGDTPNGSWSGSPFWSTDPLGEVATQFWDNLAGDTAVFSAGTDGINAFTVGGSGTSGAPGVLAAGVIIEEGIVTFSAGTLGIGPGFVAIGPGATLSTDSSLRISSSVGSVWTLDGGTARSTNAANAGSFIDIDSTITLGPGGGTISHTVNNILNIVQTTTVISGSGSLTKTGVGVIAIASASTYTGATIVNEGELRIRTTANRLPVATTMIVASPGILNLNGVNQQVGSLAGDGTVGTGAGTLTVGDASSTMFTGTIENIANAGAGAVTTGAGKVTKVGSGTLTLTGENTYTGTFTNTAGTTTVSGGGQLAGPTVDLVVNGGTLNLDIPAQTVLSLAGTGGTINLGTGHTLTVNPTSGVKTYTGVLSGAGALTKTGAGTLGLSGANDYSGVTTIGAGKIQVNSASALGTTAGDTQVASGGEVLFDGAAINFTTNEAFQIAGVGAGDGGAITIQNSSTPTISGPVTLTGDATVTVSGTATGIYNNANAFTSSTNANLTLQGGSGAGGGGTISGVIALGSGGLTKLQGGRWTLTGVNTYSGTTTIGAGTLQLGNGLEGNDGTIANSTSIVNRAALVFNRFGSDDYSGVISGTGTVNKTGAGTQTLSGANTYTGATTITGGILRVGNVSALGFGGVQSTSTGSTTVSAGFTLDLNGTSNINEPIILNGTGIGANGALLNNSGTTASIASGIAGAQLPASAGTGSGYSSAPAVVIDGTGSGATATASLGVTVASFAIDGGTTIYSAAPAVTIAGGSGATATATLTAGVVTGITVTNPGTGFTTAPTITFSGGTVTTAGINPTGTGNATEFTVSGLTVTAAGSGYTGTPTYTFGSGNATPGTLTLSSVVLSADSSVGGTGNITISSAVSESGGPRQLTKTGTGTLVISGPQSYSSLRTSDGTTTLSSALPDATITNEAGTLNINADANGSTVIANATTNIGASQTLESLDIGAGGVVTLGATPPPALAEGMDTIAVPDGLTVAGGQSVQPVPEPGALGLLVIGALGFVGRRRRQ